MDQTGTEIVDAKKKTVSAREALDLAAGMDEIWAAKGRKIVHLDMKKDKPDAATVKSLIVGPSGNLRAPTLRLGRTLLVGFHEETYRKTFSRSR